MKKILSFPTILNNTHESCFRSYHILKKVLEMIQRGDSKETIFEFVEFANNYINEKQT